MVLLVHWYIELIVVCLFAFFLQNVQYTYLSDVECISETGAADNVYIFVCGKDRYTKLWVSSLSPSSSKAEHSETHYCVFLLALNGQLHPARVGRRQHAAQ